MITVHFWRLLLDNIFACKIQMIQTIFFLQQIEKYIFLLKPWNERRFHYCRSTLKNITSICRFINGSIIVSDDRCVSQFILFEHQVYNIIRYITRFSTFFSLPILYNFFDKNNFQEKITTASIFLFCLLFKTGLL